MVAKTLHEFLDLLRSENLVEEIKSTGTSTRTEDWIIEKLITIILIDEKITDIQLEIDNLNTQYQKIILSDPKLNELVSKKNELIMTMKSMGVKLDSEKGMLYKVMQAKLEDIRRKLALKIHEDKIWVSMDVL